MQAIAKAKVGIEVRGAPFSLRRMLSILDIISEARWRPSDENGV